jgi:hypothetical protein
MMSGAARRAVFGGGVALVAGAAAVACVLADPPADLPLSPIQAPQIVRGEVQPPLSLLDTFPNQIYAPVTVDPRETDLAWQWLIDGTLALGLQQTVKIQSSTSVAILFDPVPPDLSPEECHTFELDVFYSGSSLPGDDFIWLYSPTRSFADCPVYDAGTPDAGEDAGADASGSGD